MSGTPQTEVKWQEDCNDRAGVSLQSDWSTLTSKVKRYYWLCCIMVRNPRNTDTSPADHFFVLPLSIRKIPLERSGAKQESILHLLVV